MRKRFLLGVAVIFALSAAVVYAEINDPDAVATITGTGPESAAITGTASLKQIGKDLLMNVTLQGVPPGKHGFHIHEKGDCSDTGKAAGGHYNPMSVTHGFLPTDGHEKAHCGDMGNITIAEDGTGKLELTLPGVDLASVSGLAVILHEKVDDFGQPTGNAGGRIGCGIITLTQPQTQVSSNNISKSDTLPELTREEDMALDNAVMDQSTKQQMTK